MEQRMLEAAQKGTIDELKDLISSNKLILKEMALEGAGHTLLHVACVAGHLDVVRELLIHMPKFAEKVNAGGFSPLHIAAAQGEVDIAREVLTVVGPHLCFVKGRERRIPLHYAVINGEIDVMKLLLSTSPESIEETTARKETVLHLAVKNNRTDAVSELVKHLKPHNKQKVINLGDHKGDTALHLAAADKNFEVVEFLLRGDALESEVVNVNALNKSGLTPLDVSTPSQKGAQDRDIREILIQAGAKHGDSRPVSEDSDDIGGGDGHQSDEEPVPQANQSDEEPVPEARQSDVEPVPQARQLEVELVPQARQLEVELVPQARQSDVEPVPQARQSDVEPVTQAPQSLSRSTSKKLNKDDGESRRDKRNTLLVVAAVIVNATYQSVLQPPSIVQYDKVQNSFVGSMYKWNTITYGGGLVYILFLGGNTFGFLVSVQMIICLTKDLSIKWPLTLALIAMVQTYFCFTLSLLITSTRGPATATVLNVMPLMISVSLLLIQKWLVMVLKKVLDFLKKMCCPLEIFDDMYELN